MFVLVLLYLEVVEAVANVLVNCSSSSGSDLECFANTATNPSSTTSFEASFDKSEIKTDKEVVISFSCFETLILDTSRYFPPRSSPSSSNSFAFTNIVSGIIDQTPGFEICISPDKWLSATSFGKTLVNKCSANIF